MVFSADHDLFNTLEAFGEQPELEYVDFLRDNPQFYRDLTDRRVRLWSNGYEPIPLLGKQALVEAWPDDDITEDRIHSETNHPRYRHYTNTGLRTGQLVVIDDDLFPPEQSAVIREITFDTLGMTPLIRYGSKGGAYLYRNTGEVLRKISVRGRLPNDGYSVDGKKLYPNGIEILGWHNQVAVFGWHSKAKREYQWVGNGTPLTVPFRQLPEVTPEQLRKLGDLFTEAMIQFGYELPHNERWTGGALVSDTENIGDDGSAVDITQLYLDLLPDNTMKNGWHVFDCPACNDKKSRGSFMTTPSGGWRYKCFKASCDYVGPEKTTGWEPAESDDKGVGDRARRLFELLGGNADDLPQPPSKTDWSTYWAEQNAQAARNAEMNGKETRQKPSAEWYSAMGFDEPPANDDVPRTDASPEPEKKSYRKRSRKYFDQYLDDPEIEYWDDSKLLPKIDGGVTLIFLGKRGSHKTGVVSQMIMDAVVDKGARAIYVPCEGQQFFGKQRMPAYCRDRGIHPRDLRERFECVPEGINLAKDDAAEQFVNDHADFEPHFVIIDTLAQATPGVDSNSSFMGDIMGNFGAVATIRKAFNCNVIVLGHPPEGNPNKVLGHTSIVDNTQTVVLVEYDHDSMVTCTVMRNKDGPEGQKFYYRVDPNNIPVPKLIPKNEEPANDTSSDGKGKPSPEYIEAMKIRHILGELGINDFDIGFTNNQLAEVMVPQGHDSDSIRERTGKVSEMAKHLSNTQQKKINVEKPSPYDDLASRSLPFGKKRAEWRWYDLLAPSNLGSEDTQN